MNKNHWILHTKKRKSAENVTYFQFHLTDTIIRVASLLKIKNPNHVCPCLKPLELIGQQNRTYPVGIHPNLVISKRYSCIAYSQTDQGKEMKSFLLGQVTGHGLRETTYVLRPSNS